MFTENVEHDGKSVPRFAYAKEQTGVLEVAVLEVIAGRETEFETVFAKAQLLISSMSGYISHQLKHCIEHHNRYILLVEWQTLEDHTIGFRQSAEYQHWRELLHGFYSPLPVVEHYQSFVE
jgi:heme-degrading monooxygenase HmoA